MGKSVSFPGVKGDKPKKKINLSPIEVLILTQLRSRELRNNGEPVGQYGYEMIQKLNELFAGSWKAKSGTIYPILSKLEQNKKLITGERKQSPLGPVKRVYTLEDLGRKCIDYIIYERFEGDIEFVMRYLNMLTPFLVRHDEDNNNDRSKSDEIFEKMMSIPTKSIKIAKEEAVTIVDEALRNRKLESIKNQLTQILTEIE
ncbi:PadR family transcriptional regulator [Promethearchaeum syntrophicum]|uniref:PadR family transcriptional regulator n=1 Tax=Promethearchaeum syntrophicum TaxID=2594042 RepID=A0A5B9DEX7_9ARCH|nr:PadR family transcriptional regulator [Candidatus Prometheoarchaeum syntrophicum]QEE17286.1 Transcriptional regulator PadR-like family protein [Candidatus Prometheoarchaeum syntrophicum]